MAPSLLKQKLSLLTEVSLFACVLRRVLVLSLFCFGAGARGEGAFFDEWKLEVNQRLENLLPSRSGRYLRWNIDYKELARICGVTSAFISMAVNRRDVRFSYAHAERIAARFGRTPEYFLAADLLDRFNSMAELEAALEGELLAHKAFLIPLFLAKHADVVPACRDEVAEFTTRWRREVNRRLGVLIPGRALNCRHGVSSVKLGAYIGKSQPLASAILNGKTHLTIVQAEALGRRFGVSPNWILAADLLERFSSVEDLAVNLANENRSVRSHLIQLYGRRHDVRAPDADCMSLIAN